MAIISANTLFHFTNGTSLISILENNFYPRYCRETVYAPKRGTRQMIFPMICFCDLPLSQIKSHINRYGRYGLGLTKEWGIRNGLNPVTYVQKDSVVLLKVEQLLQSNWESITALQIEQFKKDRDNLIYLYMNMKAYEGIQNRGLKTERLRFYDEREWRFVPNLSRLNDDELHLVSVQWTLEQIAKKNKELENVPLIFEPEDIKYIVIENEMERSLMIKKIREIKGRKSYTKEQIEMLNSKIISAECIKNDM